LKTLPAFVTVMEMFSV